MGAILGKMAGWAIVVAFVTTVGGWWGMAIIVAITTAVYFTVGTRPPSA